MKKAIVLILIIVGSVCLALVIFVGQNKSWQSKYEQEATDDFYKNQNAYEKLLNSWTALDPNLCGGPAPAEGLVTSESIIVENGGVYTLTVDGQTWWHLGLTDIAKRLGTSFDRVNSVTDMLKAVRAPEILQSGAAMKVISPRNDTHGLLHVDRSCREANLYEAWSKSSSIGPYMRLKSLGDGWYYYVEER